MNKINHRVAIIGIGNMGTILAKAFFDQKIVAPANLVLCSRRQENLVGFQRIKGLTLTTDCVAAVDESQVVVLAVKPKDIKDVALTIAPKIAKNALIISIAAGVRIGSLGQWLGNKLAIVRVMPNTPAKVGMAISGWSVNRHVTSQQRLIVRKFLKALGEEMFVKQERWLDQITAISGSGPAYFYYFVEALVDAGVKLHLSESQAKDLALQTFCGAAQLLKNSGKDPQELRQAVTSKGGTTEAAIESLQRSGFKNIMATAVSRAYTRAQELSRVL